MDNRFRIAPLPVTEEFLPRKRLIQDRGELALIEDGARFDHLAFFSLEPGPGRYRGGHYHKIKTERFYVISGRARVDLADPETGRTESVEIEAGQRVAVEPGLAHRFQAITPLQVIEYYEGCYDPNDDHAYRNFDPS